MGFLLWCALGWGLCVAFLSLAYRPRKAVGYDAFYTLPSKDGARLGLYRYFPDDADAPVVILCADLGEDPLLWELSTGPGWARSLQEAGYDVWIACLRGTAEAIPTADSPELGWGWWTETHLQWDMPALLAEVRAITQTEEIHWIGRGLGAYLPMMMEQPHGLASIAVAGHGVGTQRGVATNAIDWLLSWWFWPVFPLRRLGRLFYPFGVFVLWLKATLQRRDARPAITQWCYVLRGLHDVCTQHYKQWIHSIHSRSWLPPAAASAEESRDLFARMQLERTPILSLKDIHRGLALPSHAHRPDHSPQPDFGDFYALWSHFHSSHTRGQG